jgi:Rho GTPase-activating protein 1
MSADYSSAMAKAAASILYRSPIPSRSGHAIYIMNAAALPDTHEVDYDTLLPYVLARLPGEDDLVSGTEYEVVFFAGSGAETTTSVKKNRPGWGWLVQAYHVLSRAMRKRIQKLYIVHERTWVRVLVEMFSHVVSPKFRRKIVHGELLPLGTRDSRLETRGSRHSVSRTES